MNLAILKSELTTDPEALGYSGATHEEAALLINQIVRPRDRTSMSGSEILNNIDPTEWASRTVEQKRVAWDVVHMGTVNPFGVEADLLTAAFGGAGSATIQALAVARMELISRAMELGLGNVTPGDIQRARA